MPKPSVWIIRAALLYFGLGFTFGALMLYNKGVPVEPLLWRLLPAHIEIVLIGWILHLAMGTAFWVLPRFAAQPRYGSVRPIWMAFAALNLGIWVVIAGSWTGAPAWMAVGRVTELLAAALFAVTLWRRVKPLGGDAAQKTTRPESSETPAV